MKNNYFKKIATFIVIVLTTCNSMKAQVTLLYEDWSSNSFTANGWTFPNSQSNWTVGSVYTPFSTNPPNAYFNWSPSVTNYSFSMVSPTINATAYSGQQISLAYLLELNNFSTSTIEQFVVEFKNTSSSTWTTVNSYVNSVTGVTDYSVTGAVLAGMGGQNFQVKFTAFGANSFNINGWGVDSIVVKAASCPTVAPGLSVNATSTLLCSGNSVTLSASGANTYTWNPGNIVGSVITVSPSSNTTYSVAGSITGCTAVPAPAAVTISTTASPSVSITGISSLCQGQSGSMTASGASNYSWSPSAGLSSSTSASVTANPSASTSYTVLGTAANGCTNMAVNAIAVNQSPSLLYLTATPSVICSGGNSQLATNAASTNSYAISSIPYAAVSSPSSGVVTLVTGGVQNVPLTNGSLDDGDWENIPLPFGFNFFGSSYNSVAIGTNGFIGLGGIPNTYNGYGSMLPNAFSAAPSIGAIYSDLNFTTLGTLNYFTTGIAPNRKFVVNWSNVPFYFNSGTVTAQAIMYETSHIIEVHLNNSSGNNAAVEGIQNQTGSTAYVVSGRNAVNYTVTVPDGYRWSPNSGTATYSWTPSTFLSSTSVSNPTAINVTSATVYSVTATLGGCSKTATIGLNTGTSPTVNVVATPSTLCNGSGSVSISANGASSYSWNTGASTSSISVSPTVTTVYTVVGTNSTGCSSTKTVSVPVGTGPTVTIAAGTGTVCSGGSTGLTASGAATYTWNTGSNASAIAVTPSTTTTYSVSGSNGGCAGTGTVTIFVNSLPTVNISAAQPTVCTNGPTVALSGSPSGGVYTGPNVSQGFFTPGATAGTFNPGYAVSSTVTGCSNSATTTIVVSICTGVNERSVLNGLSVYPNPTQGELTIQLSNGALKDVEVLDLTGRIILSNSSSKDKITLNISNLANGIYFVKIQSNNAVEIIKVVKQ
ncbi:MAG: T9SS type A sorting domain-containing protein [Bacteroidetes bacterium]|nr:T9SS type A sorting domain-containing protein [Bacteroidota bacterium]